MAKDKFLHGAMILTLAGLVVKIIGSVNRILLSRLLGGEGIGLYQMAYPVYLLLLAISSAGIPVAISIVVSRYLAKDDDDAMLAKIREDVINILIPRVKTHLSDVQFLN